MLTTPETIEPEPKPLVPWLTGLLIASILGVFALQMYWQRSAGEDILGNTLGFSPQAMAAHRYWTLITYAWAHSTGIFGDQSLFWLHVTSNLFPLFFLGPLMERLLGHWHFFMLYLGGVIASVLTWYAFNLSSEAGIIGASGAVFALIAAAGVALPRERVSIIVLVIPLRMRLGVAAIAACAAELAMLIFGWMPGIAHEAHLGGAAFGAIYMGTLRLIHRQR